MNSFVSGSGTEIKDVVNAMYDAFKRNDMPGILSTVSEDTVWIYEGSEKLPYTGVFTGKEGVARFLGVIGTQVEVQDFRVNQMFTEGNTVVVLGFEKHKIKKNNNILEQKWVQVYTVENGLIVRMEEYANTAAAERLF